MLIANGAKDMLKIGIDVSELQRDIVRQLMMAHLDAAFLFEHDLLLVEQGGGLGVRAHQVV